MADSDSIGGGTRGKSGTSTSKRAEPEEEPEFSLRGLLYKNKKFYGFLGLIFVMLRSDIFQNGMLSRIKGATDMQGATTWGELITLLVFLFLVILVQVLLGMELI